MRPQDRPGPAIVKGLYIFRDLWHKRGVLFNRATQRVMLLKADEMEGQGKGVVEICEFLKITRGELRSMRKQEELIYSVPGPWQREFKGKVWTDMPGHDWFAKRCYFALFRRGLPIPNRKDHGAISFRGRGRPRKKPIVDPESEAVDVAPLSAEIAW